MRLRTNTTHVKNPQHSKRIPWTKYIYLSVLAIIVISLVLFAKDKILYIQAPGVLDGHTRKLSSGVKSRIIKIDTSLGEHINKGSNLVYLERGDLEENALINLDFKKSSIKQDITDTKGELTQLNRYGEQINQKLSMLTEDYNNAKKLYEMNAIPYSRFLNSKIEYDEVVAESENVQTKIEIKKMLLNTLEEQLNRLKSFNIRKNNITSNLTESDDNQFPPSSNNLGIISLISPVDGKVADIKKEVGEMVLPGETVIEVVDISDLYLKAFFDQYDEKYIQKGQNVYIKFKNGQEGKGIIKDIKPVTSTLLSDYERYIKSREEAIIVEIEPSETSQKWPSLLGMNAKVMFSRF